MWAVLGVTTLTIAIVAAMRLSSGTIDDRDPTMVGALVLLKIGNKLGSTPLYTYIGNVHPASGAIGIGLTGSSAPALARILISNVKDGRCLASKGASIVSPPSVIGSDTAFYSFHQAHTRAISLFDVRIAAHSEGSVSCDVTDTPERETYTTRRMAFAPPTNADILGLARINGFEPLWPVMANIQRVTVSTGFSTLGGTPVHDSVLGAITESSYLTRQDPILRAYWTDEPSRASQTFWLFLLAALSGLGFSMILEAIRPLIDRSSS